VSVKEQVLQAIQRLADDIDFRDVMEEIALLAAVDEGQRDIEAAKSQRDPYRIGYGFQN